MAWIYILIAGFFETGWAVGLKYTEGFTRVIPSFLTIICMAVSFGFLSISLKSIPLGTAYAVWTGIGAVGTVIAGIMLFDEPYNWARIACILLIITGILGLKLVDK